MSLQFAGVACALVNGKIRNDAPGAPYWEMRVHAMSDELPINVCSNRWSFAHGAINFLGCPSVSQHSVLFLAWR